jgi:hypothetical protein
VSQIEIQKYNHSLEALRGLIKLCAISGLVFAVIGIFWSASVLSDGNIDEAGLPLFLAYAGMGLIGISIAGALLRHAAKVIVEGLGGTIKTVAK